MPISHAFTSAIADDPTAAAAGQVLPSHWNAGHTLPSHTELSDIGTKTHAQIDTALNALGGASLLAVGTTAGTVAAGDDSRIVGAQATLVSGTNIKTVNSTSLLGSGDIAISASPGGSTTQVQFNDGGAFGGDAGLTFNKTSGLLTTPTISLGAGALLSYDNGRYLVVYDSASKATVIGNQYGLGHGVFVVDSGMYGFLSGNYNNAIDANLSRISDGLIGVGDGTQGSYAGDLKLRNLISTGVVTLASFTVGTLPSASTSGAGAMAMATDLISLVNGTTATTGGSLKGVCKSDGSAWIVLG